MRRALIVSCTVVVVLVLLACSDKFKFPNDLPEPTSGGSFDTSYVLVTPNWTSANGLNFANPNDIVVGYDRFLYVCDTDNDRIVKLTETGEFVEQYSIVHPVAVTQDLAFDLIAVCGNYMVISPDRTDTTFYGNAIYRRDHSENGEFEVVWRAESPYDSVQVQGGFRPIEAEFWSVESPLTTTKDYYVADFVRDEIRQFSGIDQPIGTLIEKGRGVGVTEYPVDLCYYEIAGFKYLVYGQGYGNLGVQPLTLPAGVPLFNLETEADTLPPLVRFNHRGFKDVAVDERSNFYVILQKLDPLLNANLYFHKFNRRGEHLLSFGTNGSGERQFNLPGGIDYLDGIIYIADTGNNRIVRYTLSTAVRQ